ncbi:hypothetical protein ACLI4Z_08265 [Natrialbaceae archaeon A-arb3/5]
MTRSNSTAPTSPSAERTRGKQRQNRAISTVVDVSICLLLITASVVLIAVFLADDSTRHDSQIADETAQTLATSTTTVEYSIQPVEQYDETGVFDDVEYEDDRYERVRHGPLAQLLAAAAVANLQLDGERLSDAGVEFEEGVDANVRSELLGANDAVHVLARWEPYESATIHGEATAGDRPPDDADVSAATLSVSSGFPTVSADDLAGTYDAENESFERTAEPIADAIVSGSFPNESTTIALQGSDLDRDLALYEYQRMGDELGVEYDLEEGNLSRTSANVSAANEKLSSNLTETIAADLEETFEPDIDEIESELDAEYPEAEDEVTNAVDELLVSAVATDDVTITVRAWNE